MIATGGKTPDALRWSASAALVIALHASFLLTLRRVMPDAGEAAPTPILMDLAPAALPVSRETVPSAPATPPEPVPPPPDPTPAVPAPATPAPPTPAPVDPASIEPLPIQPTSAEAAPIEPAHIPPPPADTVAAAPLPRVERPIRPPEPAPHRPTRPSHAALAPPPVFTATNSATSPPPPAQSAPGPTAAPPPGEVIASWQARLSAHLARFKRFPVEAQRRGEQGIVLMRFSIDRDGHVSSIAIAKGSGYADLDAEAEAWIRRAEPVPALPPEIAQARMAITVPLRFNLR